MNEENKNEEKAGDGDKFVDGSLKILSIVVVCFWIFILLIYFFG